MYITGHDIKKKLFFYPPKADNMLFTTSFKKKNSLTPKNNTHTHTLHKMYQNHKISFIKFKCNKNMKAF